MPTNRSQSHTLASLIDGFAASLSSLLEKTSMERARDAVLTAFGGKVPATLAKRRGRPPASAVDIAAPRKRRRKAPIQMCPVPGCKNRAAPIFGMVCAKHKGIAKAQIRKYREARRQKKLKAA
jgi:hypothetical protein